MPSISKAFIRKLVDTVSIEDVIGRRIKLIKKGREFQALCPFHGEKTPSFTVSPHKQFYYCFGCHASGNSLDFLKNYEKLEFIEAVESLAAIAGLQIEYDENDSPPLNISKIDYVKIYEKLANAYHVRLLNHDKVMSYAKRRNINKTAVEKFKIGYAPNSLNAQFNYLKRFYNITNLSHTGLFIKKTSGYKDRFQERLMFPIRNKKGECIAFGGRTLIDANPKYLNSPETDWFLKNKILYGLYETLNENKQPSQIIVVEGYTDVVQLFEHGFPFAVAALGTSFSSTHYSELCRVTSKIIFCFDGDRAGTLASMKACKICLSRYQDNVEVEFVILPEKEDPDSLLNHHGSSLMKQLLENALPMEALLFDHLKKNYNTQSTSGLAQYMNEINELISSMPNNATKHIFMSKMSENNLFLKSIEKKKTNNQMLMNKKPHNDASILTALISNPEHFAPVVLELSESYSSLKDSRIVHVQKFISDQLISKTSQYIELTRNNDLLNLESLGLIESQLLNSSHTVDSFKLLLIKYIIQFISNRISDLLSVSDHSPEHEKLMHLLLKEKSSLKILEESLEYRLTNLE